MKKMILALTVFIGFSFNVFANGKNVELIKSSDFTLYPSYGTTFENYDEKILIIAYGDKIFTLKRSPTNKEKAPEFPLKFNKNYPLKVIVQDFKTWKIVFNQVITPDQLSKLEFEKEYNTEQNGYIFNYKFSKK